MINNSNNNIYNINNIYYNIYYYRKLKGYSQAKLSILTGIGVNSISKYELGKNIPSCETLIKLCQVLDCTPNDLLGTPKFHEWKPSNNRRAN